MLCHLPFPGFPKPWYQWMCDAVSLPSPSLLWLNAAHFSHKATLEHRSQCGFYILPSMFPLCNPDCSFVLFCFAFYFLREKREDGVKGNMCVWMHAMGEVHTRAHVWKWKDSFVEKAFFFYIYKGSWVWTQITGFMQQVPTEPALWFLYVYFINLIHTVFCGDIYRLSFPSFMPLILFFRDRRLLCHLQRQGMWLAPLGLTPLQVSFFTLQLWTHQSFLGPVCH